MELFYVELYINGTFTDHTNWNERTEFGDVTAYNDSGAYALRFDNGAVVKISVSFDFELMTVSMVMDPDSEGKVMGLFGEFSVSKSFKPATLLLHIVLYLPKPEQRIVATNRLWMAIRYMLAPLLRQ